MKILIVEDNLKLATAIKRGLAQEGFVADVVSDGAEGEQRVTMSPEDVDLVILDLMLPNRDGLSICQQWRSQGITVPVLMLTARDTTADTIQGLTVGADDYLVKPFELAELIARVRALLRRPRTAVTGDLTLGELRLNPTTLAVSYAGQPLSLTLTEFRLLEYFAQHPNQVLDRDQLYSHAWDDAADPFSNTVNVHVKNLRRKLAAVASDRGLVLETVRGVGYRLKG